MLHYTGINTSKNKLSKQNSVLVKKLLEFSDFTKQTESNKNNYSFPSQNKVLSHSNLYYRSPLNILFSIDQFFFEFAKKSPQRKKASEFKLQLKERKKLSLFYGSLSKKQISQIVNESLFFKGHDSKKILSLLEQRLDVTLYRSNFAKNISIARQYISHKKILVNNKCVTIPSYQLNPGDIISIASQKLTKIGSTISEDVKKNVSKRNSVSLLETNILKKWAQSNSTLFKKDLEFFIGLLIKKIQSRAKIVISRDPFFTSLDQRPILENTQYFCLFTMNSKQTSQSNISIKDNIITPQIKLVNTLNSIDFSNPLIFAENLPVGFSKTKKISEYFQHELIHIILGFDFKKISREFFVLNLQKYLLKKLSKKQNLNRLKIAGVKPLHLEISYKLLKIIVLYSPQRIYYPFFIDVDLIKRSYKK